MKPQLWVDTETGGTGDDHSILQVAAIAVIDGQIVGELDMPLRIDPLVVTQEALSVNKADLLAPGIKTWAEAKDRYSSFMRKTFFNGKPINKETMPLFCGHNTFFDRPRIQKIMGGDFDFCYYHRIDTMVLASTLREMGLLPGIENAKLETLAAFFGVPKPTMFHNAMCDIKQTYQVYLKMQELIKSGSKIGENRGPVAGESCAPEGATNA